MAAVSDSENEESKQTKLEKENIGQFDYSKAFNTEERIKMINEYLNQSQNVEKIKDLCKQLGVEKSLVNLPDEATKGTEEVPSPDAKITLEDKAIFINFILERYLKIGEKLKEFDEMKAENQYY